MNQRPKRLFLFIYIMKESRTLRHGLLQYMKEGLCFSFYFLPFDVNSLITFVLLVLLFGWGLHNAGMQFFLVLFQKLLARGIWMASFLDRCPTLFDTPFDRSPLS
jgi:hypothetical protein